MKIKTSKLTGAALDWKVWELLGGPTAYPKMIGTAFLRAWQGNSARYLHPSTDWTQGGPIIERMKGLHIKHWLSSNPESQYVVHLNSYDGDWIEFGPTLLIAAMRCFVASKLGDEVDVPEELLA